MSARLTTWLDHQTLPDHQDIVISHVLFIYVIDSQVHIFVIICYISCIMYTWEGKGCALCKHSHLNIIQSDHGSGFIVIYPFHFYAPPNGIRGERSNHEQCYTLSSIELTVSESVIVHMNT